MDSKPPILPTSRPGWIKLYGLSASVYRIFTVTGLLVTTAALFKGVGVIISVAGIFFFILKPIASLAKSLWRLYVDSQLSPCRLAARLALIAAITIGPLWLIPAKLSWTAPAVVQYDPPAVLRSRAAGFVAQLHVGDGELVREGQPIVTIRNDDLNLELAKLQKEVAQTEQLILAAQWKADSSKLAEANSRKAGLIEGVQELQNQVESLVICSPVNGTLVARNLHLLIGTYIKAGYELGIVGREDSKRLKVSITQYDAKQTDQWIDHPLRILVNDQPTFTAKLLRLETRANSQPPDASLLAINGGLLSTLSTSKDALELSEPRVSGYIPLTPTQALRLRSGQRAYVNVVSRHRSIGSLFCEKIADLTSPF